MMPERDGSISAADLANGAVTSRAFADDIESDNFVAGS